MVPSKHNRTLFPLIRISFNRYTRFPKLTIGYLLGTAKTTLRRVVLLFYEGGINFNDGVK